MATTPPLTDPGDSPLPVGAMLERLVTIYGRRFGLLVIVGLIVNVPTLISSQLGSRWPSSIFSKTYPPHLSFDSGMAIRFGLAGLIRIPPTVPTRAVWCRLGERLGGRIGVGSLLGG